MNAWRKKIMPESEEAIKTDLQLRKLNSLQNKPTKYHTHKNSKQFKYKIVQNSKSTRRQLSFQ